MISRPDIKPPEWQYYLNPWWRQRHIFLTPRPVEECRRLLNETTTRFLGRRVARSLISSTDFTLCRVTFYNNSFKPYAYVTLVQAGYGGTLVEVTFSSSRWTRFFLAMWFGLLALFALLAAIAAGRQGDWTFDAFVGGMAAFGFGLNAFGRVLAGGDRAFLLGFLTDELGLADPPQGLRPIV